jgi:hypothetical protein
MVGIRRTVRKRYRGEYASCGPRIISQAEIIMNNLDSMLERNKVFAAQQSDAGTLMASLPRALPNVKAIIIGCADMRVDPAHILGIKPGEAVVIRNWWANHAGVIATVGSTWANRSGGRRTSPRLR